MTLAYIVVQVMQGKLSYTVNEADNSISRYLYGGNNGVIVREESSNCCFYTKDIKGSTMSLLSETGEPLVTYDYDDYGITKRKTAAANTSGIGIDNEICYSGGVYDIETSLQRCISYAGQLQRNFR